MTPTEEELRWAGTWAMLSLFVVMEPGSAAKFQLDLEEPVDDLRRYDLDDDDALLGGLKVVEIDILFQSVPRNLGAFLLKCLRIAMSQEGTVVAWFGFEGTFELRLLYSDWAFDCIYAVADVSGITFASGEDRRGSSRWKERLKDAGNHLREAALSDRS